MTARRGGAALAAIALAWIALAAQGCALGPDWAPPAPPKVRSYRRGAAPTYTVTADGKRQRFVPGARLRPDWWRAFASPVVDATVAAAFARSPSLEAARQALENARFSLAAGYGVFLPQVDATGFAGRERFSPSAFGNQLGQVAGQTATTPGAAPAAQAATRRSLIFNLFTLEGTVTYALDIWGRNRRAVEQLAAQADVQRWTLASARLMLASNVVNTLIARAAYRAQIDATNEFVRSLREQLHITEVQWKAGIVTYADVVAIRTQLASTAATLPPLQLRYDQASHLLATLVGVPPAVWAPADIALDAFTLPADLPVKLPSVLVRERPDILVAEANLHASSAAVGVATAAMFPAITLSGALGVSSNLLGQLFEHSSLIWNYGGNLAAPLFHGGTLWYQRKAAIALYRQTRATYRQTVLNALGDVANVLRALEHDAEVLEYQSQAVASSSEALRLVRADYRAGTVGYVQVLIAYTQYQQARIAWLGAKAQRLQDVVALFVALGGGPPRYR